MDGHQMSLVGEGAPCPERGAAWGPCTVRSNGRGGRSRGACTVVGTPPVDRMTD